MGKLLRFPQPQALIDELISVNAGPEVRILPVPFEPSRTALELCHPLSSPGTSRIGKHDLCSDTPDFQPRKSTRGFRPFGYWMSTENPIRTPVLRCSARL